MVLQSIDTREECVFADSCWSMRTGGINVSTAVKRLSTQMAPYGFLFPL
jgi:hypothetical protein